MVGAQGIDPGGALADCVQPGVGQRPHACGCLAEDPALSGGFGSAGRLLLATAPGQSGVTPKQLENEKILL